MPRILRWMVAALAVCVVLPTGSVVSADASSPEAGRMMELARRLTRRTFSASLPMPIAPDWRVHTGSTRLVVILSIDGLRPDAIGTRTPNLQRLQEEGTHVLDARTIDRSVTLPSHASMMSGVSPDKHGLRHNSWRPSRGSIRYPTVLRAAHQAGMSTSMFVGKQKLVHLVSGDEVEVFENRGVFCHRVNRKALPYLSTVRDGIHFIHYSEVDGAGHGAGWMSPRYHQMVARADGCVGNVVDTLIERGDVADTLLIVTSDHGGHRRTHGSRRSSDTHIPWIAWGGAANRAVQVPSLDTRDTAATALVALGLPLPAGMEGRPVREALLGR